MSERTAAGDRPRTSCSEAAALHTGTTPTRNTRPRRVGSAVPCRHAIPTDAVPAHLARRALRTPCTAGSTSEAKSFTEATAAEQLVVAGAAASRPPILILPETRVIR